MSHSPCPTCCDIYAEQLTVTFMLNNDTPVVLHCPALDIFRRWTIVEKATDKSFEVSSFAQLAHMHWAAAAERDPKVKHPLAPLISAWHTGPLEVAPVRNAKGNLRGDTIVPRIAMRKSGSAKADRLYLSPAHLDVDTDGIQIALGGFADSRATGRIPILPVNLYDLGVEAGEARGGRGAAPIPARMLVKLAADPLRSCDTANASSHFRSLSGTSETHSIPPSDLTVSGGVALRYLKCGRESIRQLR